MNLKKLQFPDQLQHFTSSIKRKVVSGFGFCLVTSFIILSLLLLTLSVKTPFLGSVFNTFSYHNTSILSWPFSAFPDNNSSSAKDSQQLRILNGTFERKTDFFLGNANVGNSSKKVNIQEARITNNTHVLNVSQVDKNVKNSSESANFDGKLLNFYGDCDIFDGEWVRDDSKPYYPAGSCPYIDRDFDCHLNKRPDDTYVKWRWQPYACNIPSLNATDFLERLRGQKLVFVGDSLNRNMWESLVCILRHRVKNKKRVYEISGKHKFKKKGFYAFRFEDYNCTVDFVGSPFLVRESSLNGKNGSFETLRLDLMDHTTSMYYDADIIIFNTGHWWTHEKTSRGVDYYQEGNHVHRRLKVLEAYKRALSTWASWVDKNIDGSRTQVIFRGYSVSHFRGGHWNLGGQCDKETEPKNNKAHLTKYPSKMKVLQRVIINMTTPVIYMNISRLTDYRKDGHPSIYRQGYEQIARVHAQDCSHWCLPGVPDSWNELLYASLLKSRRGLWRN
ncbi:protein trichome birefringence-like 2 isoform X2 [Lycium ferocissimum]|uniref:protein trichome birefringence-like 2 isoform X2 n=1 Tax=Lycium ferocissimum TaxID=112874 RepID=UPI0028154DF0|nr:protein trichome birefringence-like 2 isoform X2 [Lycium ferocissimum]